MRERIMHNEKHVEYNKNLGFFIKPEADRNSFSFSAPKWAIWSFSVFRFWPKMNFHFCFIFVFVPKISFALDRKCYVRN